MWVYSSSKWYHIASLRIRVRVCHFISFYVQAFQSSLFCCFIIWSTKKKTGFLFSSVERRRKKKTQNIWHVMLLCLKLDWWIFFFLSSPFFDINFAVAFFSLIHSFKFFFSRHFECVKNCSYDKFCLEIGFLFDWITFYLNF